MEISNKGLHVTHERCQECCQTLITMLISLHFSDGAGERPGGFYSVTSLAESVGEYVLFLKRISIFLLMFYI